MEGNMQVMNFSLVPPKERIKRIKTRTPSRNPASSTRMRDLWFDYGYL